jgi:phosphatidate cytidylyltransferase
MSGTPSAPGAGEGVTARRALTAVVGWPALALFLLRATEVAFVALVVLVCGLALGEFLELSGLPRGWRWLALPLGSLVCASSALGGSLLLASLAVAWLALGTGALLDREREPAETARRVAAATCGVVYVAVPLGLLILLRRAPDGAPVAAMVVLATWARDIGAFLGGHAVGGRALRPDLSPRKHLPGALGGLALAGLAVAGLQRIGASRLRPSELVALAVAIGVLGQAGDLFESLLKRRAGRRHSGRLLGEQGGVLDSIDGLLFTAPAAYACLQLAAWAVAPPGG